MTTTTQLPKPAAPGLDGDDRPALHTYCGVCWPIPQVGNIALCGIQTKYEGPAFYGPPPADWPLCVVCEDLAPAGCPKCGAGR